MNTLRRHLLVLALFSVLLVKLESLSALSIEGSLPALVLDDEPSSTAKNSDASPSSESSVTKEEDKEPKVITYETSKREEPASSEVLKDSDFETKAAKETTSQAPTAAESTTTSAPPTSYKHDLPDEPAVAVNGNKEKDINVLLANKNDAENDLTSSTSTAAAAPTEIEPKPSIVVTSDEKRISDFDLPVDTNKQANDDRLHYAFGSGDKTASEEIKPAVESSAAPKEPTSTGAESVAPEKSLEGKKGEEKSIRGEAEEKSKSAAAVPADVSKSDEDKVKEEDKFKGKKEEIDDKSKPEFINTAKEEESKKLPVAPEVKSSTKTQPPGTEPPPPLASSPTIIAQAEQSSIGAAPTSSVESRKEDPKKVEVAQKEASEVPAQAPVTEAASTAKPTTSPATSTTTTSASPVQPAKPSSEKPPSVPSILAVALGTALGAAVNPILGGNKENKPPLSATHPPLSSAASSTTKAPSVSTRKPSSTDRWDRWSPSTPLTSTSTTAPTRRRPILPSIRRRFRPYNRFSPFPWASGPDSYSSMGGEPEFMPAEPAYPSRPPPLSPSITTSKPKRRASSSDVNKSTGTTSTTTLADESDEETSTTRRRDPNNKRRNNHHHHSHGDPSERPNIRRRYNPHQHHSHVSRDRDERPSVFSEPGSIEPSFSSPSGHSRPPGFSLFNTGSSHTGSGFDLLNPFSGWLDDIGGKPQRPPSRNPVSSSSSPNRPAHRPHNPVEGEYNDNEHSHHDYGGRHDSHHGRPHREDYDDHHHHHDCHDHDYDHQHDHHRDPYRPQRPHRDREPNRPPIGGYDDSYTPPGGYGRRPTRPYNRRDQAEVERNRDSSNRELESSEASPSLYGGRVGSVASVTPRRVSPVFSPFDMILGPFDDELFGLRSSFMDTPLKGASESAHTFDAVVSSPKISMLGVEQTSSSDKESSANSEDKLKESKPLAASELSNNDFMRRTKAFG